MSNRTLKVLIIGDGSVGKTSLRSRYLNGSFQKAYITTIGADFVSKTLEVKVPIPISLSCNGKKKTAALEVSKKRQQPSAEGDQGGEASTSLQPLASTFQTETARVTLSIWDTAGQERFKSLGSAFYRGSDAVIIAFDLTKKGSLARTINWYNEFCKLGDIGYEDERMNTRQLKRAREQKERFCWVGVGCKGDLLEELSAKKGSTEQESGQESEWKGTSWTEARGWFDTMIPRLLPDGEVEKQRYPNGMQDHNGEAAVPYTIGEQVPARPEDVLSRPNEMSNSSESTERAGHAASSPGRPAEAGLAPGNAPAPGTKLLHKKSHQRNGSKSKGLREKRKSIRSIEVWQGADTSTLSSSADTVNSSSTTMSPSVPIRNGKDQYHRNRFDSTTSAGGAPSIYYSVRGSTVFGQSPAGASASSPDGSTGSSERTTTRGGHHSRGISLSSQARIRKQSNLSEVLTNEDDEEDSTTTGMPSTLTNGSSRRTIRGAKQEQPEGEEAATRSGKQHEEVDIMDGASIPTVPSGDPIPFPSSDDYEDDGADINEMEVPKRRGTNRRKAYSTQPNGKEEGEIGRKAKVIAEQTQQDITENEEEQHRLGLNGEPIDPRATLYSARPSSISSTIKAAEESVKSDDQDGNDKVEDAGLVYRDQMIEQGFRLFFTSAKDGEGIDDVFEHIAKRVAMRWKLEEWEEQKERERGGEVAPGQVRTAPPTDEEVERDRVRRAIRISSGKGNGSCCS